MTNYIFVYGLLRRGAQHEMSEILNRKSQFISEGTFQGKLYLIDYYPGIIPSDDPSDKVIGDLLKLNDSSFIEDLDHFEGIGKEFEQPNEYRREIHAINNEKGESKNAWIYLYNWSVQAKNEISSGDFLRFIELK